MKKIFTILLLAGFANSANCQWNNNTTINNAVSNREGVEYNEVSISDAANGSIIFMNEYAPDGNVFAQRITSTGSVAWGGASSPVNLSNSPSQKYDLFAVPDGSGGAFVAWSDYRDDEYIAEIYIQKISATGVLQWTSNGVRVTNNVSRDDFQPLLCSDGAGGVILTWYGDDTTAKNIQSYAQRYNSLGVAQWTANGVQVCTAAGFRAASSIVSDGANGAFIFFIDTRNDPNGTDYDYLVDFELTNTDIYGQRLNGSGTRLWTNNGAAIITAPGNQNDDLSWDALPDGSGNVILVFDDGRNDDGNFTNYDIFAQKVNSSGVALWAANGVAVMTAAENQYVNCLASDGAGGVIISIDYEAAFNRLYAQRVTAAGAVAWAPAGVAVSQAGEEIYDGSMASDANGNSIFSYQAASSSFLKAQKLNGSGVLQWAPAGVMVCNATDAFANHPTLTASDAGSMIIAWSDSRNFALPSSGDVYASKLLTTGVLAGSSVGGFTSIANGNWNNPAIWSGGIVPTAGAAVIVRHNVVGNINASCASVTVESPGNLTVNNGIVISITN